MSSSSVIALGKIMPKLKNITVTRAQWPSLLLRVVAHTMRPKTASIIAIPNHMLFHLPFYLRIFQRKIEEVRASRIPPPQGLPSRYKLTQPC